MVAVIGGAISGIGSLAGGIFGSSGAQQAAATNARAEQQAINASLQEQQNAFGAGQYAWGQLQGIAPQFGGQAYNTAANYYDQAAGQLYPFVVNGQAIGGQLTNELQNGTLGQAPDMFNLQNLPGYQFTLDQGLKATQNAAAAQGLGVSGPALKGAANYAENTANTFANNYLQNYWANQNNRYNMLAGVQNTGAQAAGQLGTIAGTTGNNLASGYFGQGNALTGAGSQLGAAAEGAASAAGGQQASAATAGGLAQGNAQQNAANLLGSGFSGAASGLSNALLLNQLLNNNGGSTIFGGGTNNIANASIAAGGPPLAPNISNANYNALLGY